MLPNKRYDDLQYGVENMNIRNNGSPITIYIQHPIPIPAPGDKNKATSQPLKLTKKVSLLFTMMKQLMYDIFHFSRNKRSYVNNAARQICRTKETVSVWALSHRIPRRVRAFPFPAVSPSLIITVVRLANLMKVLTSDAVQDPTRVEARVRREVAMRKHQHEKMNAERKLTDEQKKEKVENKKLEQEKKGIFGAVFK